MANNYVQCSFAFDIRSPEERAFLDALEERAEAAEELDVTEDGNVPPFEISVVEFGWGWTGAHDDDCGCFYAEEGGNIEAVVVGLQEFLTKFRGPRETISLTWANTCSAMRPGNFSGGGVVFTATDARWINVDNMVVQLEKDMRP